MSFRAHAASSELMSKIIQCESSFRPNVWGDDHKSYGLAQFRKETFYEFAHQAKPLMKKAGLWPAQWTNPKQQLFLLNWGLDHGYANRWTCYRKIKKRELQHNHQRNIKTTIHKYHHYHNTLSYYTWHNRRFSNVANRKLNEHILNFRHTFWTRQYSNFSQKGWNTATS